LRTARELHNEEVIVRICPKAIAALSLLVAFVIPGQAAEWSGRTDAKETAVAVKSFETRLRGIGSTARLTSCSHVVTEGQGRIGMAFGAICALKTTKAVLEVVVCQSEAIGSFALYSGDHAVSDSEAGEFMEKNCMAT
jgi:hypothetical protein